MKQLRKVELSVGDRLAEGSGCGVRRGAGRRVVWQDGVSACPRLALPRVTAVPGQHAVDGPAPGGGGGPRAPPPRLQRRAAAPRTAVPPAVHLAPRGPAPCGRPGEPLKGSLFAGVVVGSPLGCGPLNGTPLPLAGVGPPLGSSPPGPTTPPEYIGPMRRPRLPSASEAPTVAPIPENLPLPDTPPRPALLPSSQSSQQQQQRHLETRSITGQARQGVRAAGRPCRIPGDSEEPAALVLRLLLRRLLIT
ncbi:hypothetical protein O3P69_019538 [Scylla paramamosain]|uniref:Uncharacterized protein n=1 Tax=Scylla paramamosain TaxID=85552 RepID=A0AAW0SY71_SCYPA